jgi:hypothetical protein
LLEIGDIEEGERRGREGLTLARKIEDRTYTLFGLGLLAWAAAEGGEAERAGVLWAAIEAEEARAPDPMWAAYRDRFGAHIPEEPRPSSPLGLDEAAEYALSDG